MSYDKKILQDLIEGKLEWTKLKEIISAPKDADRFFKVLEILQEKVQFKEKIILPLTEHLYIVKKENNYIVKCDCGYEFDNYKKNWKHQANIYLRDTEKKLQEIYPPFMHSQADWIEIREFYCPGCFALLETEALPPGYPVILDFVPDLEGFYKETLGCELP